MLTDEKLTNLVLSNILCERERQDTKWGEQNHQPGKWMLILQEELGEVARANLEGDRAQFVKELVEAAAVITAWVEAEVRRYEYDTGIRHRPSGGLAFDYEEKLPNGILPYAVHVTTVAAGKHTNDIPYPYHRALSDAEIEAAEEEDRDFMTCHRCDALTEDCQCDVDEYAEDRELDALEADAERRWQDDDSANE